MVIIITIITILLSEMMVVKKGWKQRFSLRVSRMDKKRNRYVTGIAQVGFPRFGYKFREAWFSEVEG